MAIIGFVIICVVAVYLLGVGIIGNFAIIGLTGKLSANNTGPVIALVVGGFLAYYAYQNAPFSVVWH